MAKKKLIGKTPDYKTLILLETIPEHMDENKREFLDDLLTWSEKLSANVKKGS